MMNRYGSYRIRGHGTMAMLGFLTANTTPLCRLPPRILRRAGTGTAPSASACAPASSTTISRRS